MVPHLNIHSHSSSAHILKEFAVVGGRKREAHDKSLFILSVLVIVLALYWKPIIEEVFVGFSPP
jgi:hypothetical protein